MQLELSRRAQADLDDIRDYSVQQFGLARAIAYLDEIEATFRRVVSFPEVGVARPDLRPGLRALGCQQHRIFYTVEADRIRIRRVLHSAMDATRHV